jgi:hypothetical protein
VTKYVTIPVLQILEPVPFFDPLIRDPGWGKIRILDKHLGSELSYNFWVKNWSNSQSGFVFIDSVESGGQTGSGSETLAILYCLYDDVATFRVSCTVVSIFYFKDYHCCGSKTFWCRTESGSKFLFWCRSFDANVEIRKHIVPVSLSAGTVPTGFLVSVMYLSLFWTVPYVTVLWNDRKKSSLENAEKKIWLGWVGSDGEIQIWNAVFLCILERIQILPT